LEKAKTNELVYEQMSEYLLKGFNKLGFTDVMDYIINNFVVADNLCLDSESNTNLQMRINQARFFQNDIKVPNIKLPSLTGKTINLYDISADNILILFYSSQCPHCQDFLPKLLKFYLQNKSKFILYAISLDTDFNKWKNFVNTNNYNWINVSDLKGWKSKVSYDYYLYATPTMFLVDSNFRVIGLPNNIIDIQNFLFNKAGEYENR